MSSLPLQTGHVTVEVVLVSGSGTRIGVLPESVILPPVRQSPDGAGIAGDPQRAVGSERGAVTSAGLPPVGGGVDHWVAALAGTVGVGEILNPADHRSGAQAITSGTTWVICPVIRVFSYCWTSGVEKKKMVRTFDVESTREGFTITTPASTVGGKEFGLGSTRGTTRVGEVVSTTNETGTSGASVLGGEIGVLVG